MAIFSPIPGLEVTICVGNKPLQEYKNEDLEVGPGDTGVYQASVTSANFIEAPSGQEYAICLTLNNPTTLDCPAIGFEVFIDGISVLHLCIPASFYKGKEFKHHIYGIKSTQTDATKCTIRNFKFESIQTFDDSSCAYRSVGSLAKDIGEVIVHVHRRSKLLATKIDDRWSGAILAEDKRLHEKELKGQAKSYGTGLSRAQPSVPDRRATSHLLDAENRPKAIFQFSYRSRNDLKALLIVKRSPSPEAEAHHVKAAIPKLLELVVHKEEVSQPNVLTHPNKDLEEEDDLSDFTPEQRARVERHLARRSARGTSSSSFDAGVKNENSATAGIASSTIKTEERPAQLTTIKRENPSENDDGCAKRRRRTLGKMTIDLTEDDDDIPQNSIGILD